MHNNTNANLPAPAVRNPATLYELDSEPADGDAFAQQIQAIQSVSERPRATTWRRAFLLWLRIYQWEKIKDGSKAKRLDLRIPIPVPILGVFLRRRLTWEQALHLLHALRRSSATEMFEPYLDGCMALEVLRIEEEKNDKQELLVIGLD